MEASSDGGDLPGSSQLPEPDILRCDKCDKEFKQQYHWKKHRDSPPAYCVTEQARRARKQTALQRQTPLEDGELRVRLAYLRQNHFLPDHIPKSVRRLVASAFLDTLRGVSENNSVTAWTKLIMFSYSTLGQPRTSPEERNMSLPQSIRENLRDGNTTVPTTSQHRPAHPRAKQKDVHVVKQVARKIQDGDLTGAVRSLISAETILPTTPATLEILRSKHPKGDAVVVAPDSPLAPLLTCDEVCEAIHSFRNSSAAGPDGLRAQYLKELLACTQGREYQQMREQLTAVGNILLKGTVPEEIRPLLYEANLFAFGEKDGGVRPIAVGFTLRRMMAMIVSKRIRHLNDKLHPVQLGFATPRGVEAAVHAARTYIEAHQAGPSAKIMMKLDVTNAFNSVDRNALLEAVKSDMPGYSPFVAQAYGAPSYLLYDSELILSKKGLQQGDPFGPAGYCITTARAHRDLKSDMVQSYFDDDVIAGSPEDVLRARSLEIGLNFNLGKGELAVFGGSLADQHVIRARLLSAFPELQIPPIESWTYLGSSLTAEAVAPALSEATDAAKNVMDRFGILPAHHAFHILRICMGPTKLFHIFRTCRAYDHPDILLAFDEKVRLCLSNVIISVVGTVWSQTSFPISMGGIGIRRASELALPAFLASAHACHDLIKEVVPRFEFDRYLADTVERWIAIADSPVPESSAMFSQKAWDVPVLKKLHAQLKEDLGSEPTAMARVKAIESRESSAWLRALPAAILGNLLDNSSFWIAVGLRFGAKVISEHRCACEDHADEMGYHALSCGFGSGRHRRHTNLNETTARAFAYAGIKTELEPVGLSLIDGKSPDGLTLEPWERGKSLTWDATVVCTLGLSHPAATLNEVGAAANQAERRKNRIYEELKPNYMFVPAGFETFGPWGREPTKLLPELGKRIQAVSGNERSTEFLRHRISLDIQRGNASCILGILPQPDNMNDLLVISMPTKFRG